MWKYTKRSSFILLEVFIAISLVCLSLHSLISIPSICFHKELRILKDLEITRLEDVSYMELLEKLPGQLSLDLLTKDTEGANRHRIELLPQVVYLGKDLHKTYHPYAILWLQKKCDGVRLVRCNIIFEKYLKKIRSNKKFMYKIIVHEKEQKKIHNPNRGAA